MMNDIVRVDACDSTQTLARALVDEGAAHGTIVVARTQTAGRGRRGRTWLAPAGALTLSIVWRPGCALRDAHRITLGAAKGLLDALDVLPGLSGGLTARAAVKWPNDLVIPWPDAGPLGPFRKVAGVLVEVARADAEVLHACVIGIGVNVRAPAGGWPDEIARTAGALADAGYAGDADGALDVVRAHVPPALTRAVTAFDHTLHVLRKRSATLGRRVEVDGIDGDAVQIDDEGALVIADDEGIRHTVRAGDVWVRALSSP